MFSFLSSLFSYEEVSSPETDECCTEVKTEEQTKALAELKNTYNHPIKCSYQTYSKNDFQNKNSVSILRQREYGLINFHRYPDARYRVANRSLPNKYETVASMLRPVFCGQFSSDGQRFVSACQDSFIRVYDTTSSRTFNCLLEIPAENIGWSILDTALSHDRTSIAYSTWSDCIYLIKFNENQEQSNIAALYLRPESDNLSIFSLQYSVDGSEIISGANDACVYVYDLKQQCRTLCVEAHENDVNAVRFIDNSNSLIVSGSDDGLVSVWDRRALKESDPMPVGIFAGHTSGITFLDSRMDARYLISNSKDQSIKLWDMRRFSDSETIKACLSASNALNNVWDYRIGVQPKSLQRQNIPGDPSVCTYRGHTVVYTLIRCYFSPSFTTGQRYIVSGSSDGSIYIYDILTGKTERCLSIRNNRYGSGRDKCVRDVAWHPFENYIISTSWDSRRSHVRWINKKDDSAEPSLSPPLENRTQFIPNQSSTSSFSDDLSNTSINYQMIHQQYFEDSYDTDSDN